MDNDNQESFFKIIPYFNLENYLSTEVDSIVSAIVGESTANKDEIDEIWIGDKRECLLNSDNLAKYLSYEKETNGSLDFFESVKNLKCFFKPIKEIIKAHFDYVKHASYFFQNDLELFKINVIDLLFIENESDIHIRNQIAFLNLFSMFEHNLGNILYSLNDHNSSKVPFLLRDLVNHPILIQEFGISVINLLKILVYKPTSLNLRNLAWHGFLNIDQFHDEYLFFLIALIRSIDHELKKSRKIISGT